MGAVAAGLLAGGLYMLPAADAGGETRTMTLYSVNTKEKLTTTYMVNGRHVPAELKKINHLLRDWRRNAVTKMDTRTIDLMWELHADLGSRAPIHIISGYRSAETNAMLKTIGRNVAKRSMHVQGKAIDLYFPDVPTERLRNSALVRDIGGVGFYPRSGASGFVHVDSGRVRHWPRIGADKIARIRRDYRQTVGARLGRGQAVQVATVQEPMVAEQGYPTPMPRPRPIEVLMMAAAQTFTEPVVEPVIHPVAAPVPVRNFSEAALRGQDRAATKPRIEPKADLAAASMTIEPVAARAPGQNFAERPSPVRDTLATELDYDADLVVARVIEIPPPVTAAASGAGTGLSFLTSLRDGIAAGAEDLLAWPAQWIRSAESLIWDDGPSNGLAANGESVLVEGAKNPFPPITEEESAELEVIIAALRSKADYDDGVVLRAEAPRPAAKGDRVSTIRARKGDLILTAPIPRYGAALAAQKVSHAAAQPAVDRTAVKTFEKLLQASDKVE